MTSSDLKDLRRKHKVDILELSQKSGVDLEKIISYELGELELPSETVQMLADTVKRVGKL